MVKSSGITADQAARLAGEARALPDPEARVAVWFGLLAALLEQHGQGDRRPS